MKSKKQETPVKNRRLDGYELWYYRIDTTIENLDRNKTIDGNEIPFK